jgi:hypothetical protein
MADYDSPRQMRASDAERAATAQHLSNALAEGRLTPAEAEERLAACWAARYDDELTQLTADLPEPTIVAPAPAAPPVPSRIWSGPLVAHAAIVAMISTLLIVGWSAGGGPEFDGRGRLDGPGGPGAFGPDHFFWPIFPIFWLAVSVLVHAGIRISRRYRGNPSTTRRFGG